MLIGKRIRLRPLCDQDAEPIERWMNDAEIVPTVYPVTAFAAHHRIAKSSKPSDQRAVFTIESLQGSYLGEARLFNIALSDRHGELGLIVADRVQWGRGIGRDAAMLLLDYAFEELELSRVTARIRDDNPRALAFARSLCFSPEARLRARFYRKGRYIDCHELSLSKEEWLQHKRAVP